METVRNLRRHGLVIRVFDLYANIVVTTFVIIINYKNAINITIIYINGLDRV